MDLRPEVQVVFIGKQGGNPDSTSQETINQLLVKYASEYNLVVRLKGGDVAFFSNVLDELETLIAHQIPYEIIPGVTSASGASAYAGIPLTARNYATAVRFLTYTNPENIGSNSLKEWAETNDTLIFYMSSRSLNSLLNRLIENNIANDKWVAVIEQATTPSNASIIIAVGRNNKCFAPLIVVLAIAPNIIPTILSNIITIPLLLINKLFHLLVLLLNIW